MSLFLFINVDYIEYTAVAEINRYCCIESILAGVSDLGIGSVYWEVRPVVIGSMNEGRLRVWEMRVC